MIFLLLIFKLMLGYFSLSSHLFSYQIASVSFCRCVCVFHIYFCFYSFPFCVFVFDCDVYLYFWNINSKQHRANVINIVYKKKNFILAEPHFNGKHVHFNKLNHNNFFILFHPCEVHHLNQHWSTAITPGLARHEEWLSQSNPHLTGHFVLIQMHYYLIHLIWSTASELGSKDQYC